MWVRNLSPWSVDCCSKDKSPYRNASLGFHFYLGIWKESQTGRKATREGFESLPAYEEMVSRMSFRHFQIVLQLPLCILQVVDIMLSAGWICKEDEEVPGDRDRNFSACQNETQIFTLCCTQMYFFVLYHTFLTHGLTSVGHRTITLTAVAKKRPQKNEAGAKEKGMRSFKFLEMTCHSFPGFQRNESCVETKPFTHHGLHNNFKIYHLKAYRCGGTS